MKVLNLYAGIGGNRKLWEDVEVTAVETDIQETKQVKYPDMNLYQEIIYLQNWFKGKWVVENVISYYKPLIEPQECENHYFWANFIIQKRDPRKRGIRTQTIEEKESELFTLDRFDITKTLKRQMLNNCVYPELGLHIFEASKGGALF